MKKVFEWTVILGAWALLFCFGVYATDGISRGSQGWIGLILFILVWMLHSMGNRLDEHKRRIERLEAELGDHKRAHGHITML